jgi:hypothetical protein
MPAVRAATHSTMPCVVIPCSQHFFRPDRATSSQPLVIFAGFDGTGLSAVSLAMRHLGRSRIRYPAISVAECTTGKPRACSPTLLGLYTNGFQGDEPTPEMWQRTDAVMGHPVPMFTWDILEAYPQAKVVLTVRNADDWWRTIQAVSPYHGSAQAESGGIALLRLWVWGLAKGMDHLSKRLALRKYFEHNAKVIHGVPVDRLLVWDVHQTPEWGPLCDFLQLPTPVGVPFPKPSNNEL